MWSVNMSPLMSVEYMFALFYVQKLKENADYFSFRNDYVENLLFPICFVIHNSSFILVNTSRENWWTVLHPHLCYQNLVSEGLQFGTSVFQISGKHLYIPCFTLQNSFDNKLMKEMYIPRHSCSTLMILVLITSEFVAAIL